MISKKILLFVLSLMLIGCANTNHTKTDKKILDYETYGSPINSIYGSPSASILLLTIDISNYLKFNLNNKEIDLHTNSIQVALNNTSNGEIVS